jgi:rod shape-determining protein MreD
LTINFPTIARLVAVGLVGGIFQLTAVSQLPIFGVPADIVPLITVSIALLGGSTVGAIFGFCMGLFIDTAMLQTLGLSSLVLTGVGYGAGRLRELRDSSSPVALMAVGALSTAVTWCGYAIFQFLLGAPVPMASALLQNFLMVVTLNGLLVLAVYGVVARIFRSSDDGGAVSKPSASSFLVSSSKRRPRRTR